MELSRHIMNTPRIGVESILQKKKNWLRDKVEEIRTSYNDTLCAFKDNLDAIVAEPVNTANNLLGLPDNALSLQDIAAAGIYLQECNKRLFDLLLIICTTENRNEGAGNSNGQQMDFRQYQRPVEEIAAILPNEDAIHIISAPQQINVDYMQLEASSDVAVPVVHRSGLRYNSENENGPFERLHEPVADVNNNTTETKNVTEDADLDKGPAELNLTSTSITTCEPNSTPKKKSDASLKNSSDPTQTSSDISSDVSCLDRTPTRRTYYSYSSEERENNVFQGLVSDVISPSRFSVQPEQNKYKIRKLQHDLNHYYERQTSVEISQLEFKSTPLPGEYCAVVYQPDNNWYRALVLDASTQPTIMVEYIDYGNVDEVPWTSALKLHPRFTQQPRLSICCCLADVKPLSPRDISTGYTAYDTEWDLPAVEWFDKFVYNQTYEVVTVENPTSTGKISVKLFYTDYVKGKTPTLRNVSNMLVSRGYGTFVENEDVPVEKLDQKSLEQLQRMNEKNTEIVVNDVQIPTSVSDINQNLGDSKAHSDGGHPIRKPEAGDANKVRSSSHRSYSHSTIIRRRSMTPPVLPKPPNIDVTRSLSCIPAGMERTHNSYMTRPKKSSTSHNSKGYVERKPPTVMKSLMDLQLTPKRSRPVENMAKPTKKIDSQPLDHDINPHQDAPFLTPTSSVSPTFVNDPKTAEEDKKMSEWNPMKSDFDSSRNCYAVDDENACVATEGFDPEKLNVCPHYVRGNCWNGDKCPNSHPARSPSGEFKNEIQTFSASSMLTLDLNEGSWCIVRLTVSDATQNFHVHVVKVVDNMKECIKLARNVSGLPVICPDLGTLMSDMKQYYSKSTRRLKDLIRPCKGEMYSVHVPEESCFYRGMILEVSYSTTSFTTARVHLVDFGRDVLVLERYLHPMCAAFMHLPRQAVQCCLNEGEDYEGEKLDSNGCRPHLAMQIHGRCEETDGPLITSLFRMDKDGLHRITQF